MIAACLACAAIAAGLIAVPGAGARGIDRDCSDFATQAEAQEFYEANGPGDPHLLDGDGDGVACEDNPCPCAGPGEPEPPPGGHATKKRARVLFVTDGDTISVKLGKRTESVRLIGIDTPETYSGTECGGKKATRSMKKMVEEGDRVRLISDPSQDNRDQYDRLLRFVEKGKRDLGREQVKRGWAEVYVFETPFARLAAYESASSSADAKNRGVWGRCGGNFHLPE